MAQRRMLSRQFLHCEAYIELSAEAKALYPYLMVEADDDGLVANVKSICRVAAMDIAVVDELTEAGFLIRFDSGVYAIVHFCAQNKIQPSRYTKTNFVAERLMLELDSRNEYHLYQQDVDMLPTQSSGVQSSQDQVQCITINTNSMKDSPEAGVACPICHSQVSTNLDGSATCTHCQYVFNPADISTD